MTQFSCQFKKTMTNFTYNIVFKNFQYNGNKIKFNSVYKNGQCLIQKYMDVLTFKHTLKYFLNFSKYSKDFKQIIIHS